LRVLFVTPRYNPSVGGVEQHVAEVGRRLAVSGCTVGVLTTDLTGKLPSEETVDGVTIRRVRAWPRTRDYFFAPGVFTSIAAGGDEWDIVHVQSYHTLVAPLAMLGARRARLPYILTFHGGGHSSRSRRMMRRFQWRVLAPLVRHAARLVAIARFEIDLYGSAFKVPHERFIIISNGVDVPTPRSSTGAPSPSGGRIASIGRLEHYKGHQRILAAFPWVLAARPDARLWIAGTGPYEPQLRAQAAELGVADRVEIRAIPPDERERMADEVAGSSLVVLMSEYETQPLAVLEAVALGRPVLVADTSGMTELAERGLAVAVPLDTPPRELASAVIQQLDSPRLPPPIQLPTWDDCAASLLALYESVLSDRSERFDGTKSAGSEVVPR
jgi:glycogen synthase